MDGRRPKVTMLLSPSFLHPLRYTKGNNAPRYQSIGSVAQWCSLSLSILRLPRRFQVIAFFSSHFSRGQVNALIRTLKPKSSKLYDQRPPPKTTKRRPIIEPSDGPCGSLQLLSLLYQSVRLGKPALPRWSKRYEYKLGPENPTQIVSFLDHHQSDHSSVKDNALT